MPKIRERVRNATQAASDFLQSPKTHRTLIHLTVFSFLFLILLFIGIISYWVFYWIYVPKIALSEPVYLQYTDGTNPPIAHIELSPPGKYLAYDQTYSIDLQLVVTSSETNMQLGNFMVTLELMSSDNSTIVRSSRPAIVKYESGLYRTLSIFYHLLPLLFEWTREEQKLCISLLENFRQSSWKGVTSAVVKINRPELQVYSSKLNFHAKLQGLRYWMYFHPSITFVVFTSVFVLWETIFAFLAWNFVSNLIKSSQDDDSSKIIKDEDDDVNEEESDIKDETDTTFE